ncbi:acyl-CoA dehydrogenase family protein [Aeromicrobium fastidiosum]|uniref:Acyl-CoA dehydrogenase n=1 Tax=Aeromicrobium fastidiosum TaxID=52699 RepID=A0A641ARF8_9ACTN|nr:acyl-CoA dehydrogenase family protein [Aeromicrobium fastidiosum]KAA1380696.1 acyl-CoA dehydrogenase [Aeromicrobium fastidiosum]MBP2390308.1 alkylation response protein AidB-like acyl-CoA dehydrogenase [Aeromicrobium fastidiosum]
MDFTLDSEQTALRDAVRGLLGKAYGSSEDRRTVTKTDPGWDEKTWQRLAEMGALGLPFAEEDGGFGAGPVEVSIVAEEIGRVIAPEPYVEAVVLAGGLVAAAGTAEQRAEIIGALAEGQLVPAFAHTEPGNRYSEVPTVTATKDGDAWTLSGVKEPVLGGARADLLIVSATIDGGTGLFVVQPDASGLTRTSYATFDGGRAAHVAFDSTPATPLGEPGADQSDVIASAVAAAQIAYGHEALGAMAFALETTTEYLKSRKQFGVPLMTFQALTFRAADMYVSLELARSTVTWATLVQLDGGDDAAVLEAASRAKLQVSKAGRHIGQEAIQLHGGIGMTAEYSVGHYTSRLTAIDHALGDGRHHLTALSKTLDDHEAVEPLP